MILGNLFAYLALLAEELTILLSWLTASIQKYDLVLVKALVVSKAIYRRFYHSR